MKKIALLVKDPMNGEELRACYLSEFQNLPDNIPLEIVAALMNSFRSEIRFVVEDSEVGGVN